MSSTDDSQNSKAPQPYSGYEAWKGWDVLFRFDDDAADYFRRECIDLRIAGAEVLEIGFGSGSFIAWAKAEGATVSGTEVIPALLDAAKQHGVGVLSPDLEGVAHLHRDRFDTIVAFDVFEHMTLEEIEKRLKTLSTMLKAGGHLLLRFPNAQSPFGLAPQFGDPTHRSALSRGVFERLAQGTEWQILRYGGAARAPGRSMLTRIVRGIRYALRDLISWSLSAIYAQDIPWDAVVVIVLRRGSAVR